MTEHDPPGLVPGTPALPPDAAARIAADARALVGAPARQVAAWFKRAMDLALPAQDGSIDSQRVVADAVRRRALAANSIAAYRSGVKAWCAYAARHDIPALPAAPDDVKAFLVDQRAPLPPRRGVAMTTLRLRAQAIGYMHRLADLPSPTRATAVLQTLQGYQQLSAEAPRRKLALRLDLLSAVIGLIPDDLTGLRDKAVLLLGFAGALRRSELAALELGAVEIIETAGRRGLRLRLTRSKGDRAATGTSIVIPAGTTALCPLAAYRAWIAAAALTDGPVFRTIHIQPRPPQAPASWQPASRAGSAALCPRSIANIVKRRGAAAGLDPDRLGGHSLKRGALNTAGDHGAEPKAMKALGRHKSYSALAEYLDERETWQDGALAGLY